MTEAAGHNDKRVARRRRTRLRSGKIVDGLNRFIIDCAIHDRSAGGARLRLPEPAALPDSVRLYDDEQGTLRVADIVWRTEREVGVRFPVAAEELQATETLKRALAGKYYALKR